jgi:hypothetical protein
MQCPVPWHRCPQNTASIGIIGVDVDVLIRDCLPQGLTSACIKHSPQAESLEAEHSNVVQHIRERGDATAVLQCRVPTR